LYEELCELSPTCPLSVSSQRSFLLTMHYHHIDPFATHVHGKDPQMLIEKITRLRIYASRYWKEQCFGLNAETILEKAIHLSHIGGVYSGVNKPTPFLCLLLKLLQIQPDMSIIQGRLRFISSNVCAPYSPPLSLSHFTSTLHNRIYQAGRVQVPPCTSSDVPSICG
jgi:hypothetical protein